MPTLGQLIKERSRLPVVDAQNIITQVISGLRAFHRRDVLHQDIKPDNIIYTDEGVKIIDFGSCRSAGIAEIRGRIDSENRLGSRDYCAAEYLLNTPVSPLSDQFSSGVLRYELLTGKHPFGDDYARCESAADFARLRYQPSCKLNPLVPVWLDGAIHKALSIHPGERYEALSEFAQDIKTPNPLLSVNRGGLVDGKNALFLWKAATVILLLANLITVMVLFGQ